MALRTKAITTLALMCAAGLVLGYLENALPIFTVVPGGKIGLANAVTMLIFCTMGAKTGFLFGVLRCLLSAALYQGFSALAYSLAGTIFSILAMATCKKLLQNRTSPIGVSIIGAAFFNVGQLTVCAIVLESGIAFYYLPALLAVSAFSGALTGDIARRMLGLSSFKRIIKDKNGDIKTWK